MRLERAVTPTRIIDWKALIAASEPGAWTRLEVQCERGPAAVEGFKTFFTEARMREAVMIAEIEALHDALDRACMLLPPALADDLRLYVGFARDRHDPMNILCPLPIPGGQAPTPPPAEATEGPQDGQKE